MSLFPHAHWFFEDVILGRTYEFGAARVDAEDIAWFHDRFAPNMPLKELGDKGPRAAESHVYALWRKMLYDETRTWPIVQRQAQDALRYYKPVFAGDVLNVKLTFVATEDHAPDKGVLISSQEVLDQDGLIVMSLLTRMILAKRPTDQPLRDD